MAKLSLEESVLTITADSPTPKPASLRLDALRLVFLVVPAGHSLGGSISQRTFVDLDELGSSEYACLTERIAAAPLDGLALFLNDYMGRYATITLQDATESGLDLLAELRAQRDARRKRLAEWSRNAPGLIISGVEGDQATFNLDGVRAGARCFVAWEDVERLDMRAGSVGQPNVYRFVAKPGRGEAFSVRMPQPKADHFRAEYAF
ncbi:MAG TPA: hypothetical protein PLG21_12960, partial [Anaerolineae bacterium]|nr:hypothetical protein [Anaerolineae bacterium]